MTDARAHIDVDHLMARIRAEVARRRQGTTQKASGASDGLDPLPPFYVARPSFASKATFAIDDFLVFHDVDFINAVYEGVLKRTPDTAGKVHHLTLLRSGESSKAEIVANFCDSSEGRQAGVSVQGVQPPIGWVEISPPRLAKPEFATKAEYTLDDFLALHDADFIDAAYSGLLGRDADSAGAQHFLVDLRNGSRTKIEILGALRYSAEGKRARVNVRGLRGAFIVQRAYRLPVVGPLVALASAMLRLPRIVRSLQSLESYQHQRNVEFEAALAGVTQAYNASGQALAAQLRSSLQQANRRAAVFERQFVDAVNAFAELEKRTRSAAIQRAKLDDEMEQLKEKLDAELQRVAQAETRLETRAESIESHLESLESLKRDLDQRLADALLQVQMSAKSITTSLGQRLADVLAQAQQISGQQVATLRDSLGFLERSVSQLRGSFELEQTEGNSHREHLADRLTHIEGRINEYELRLQNGREMSTSVVEQVSPASRFDALYYAFEQRFRGTREDIRKRIAYYLPLLRDSVAIKEGAPVLDIGCGRGEWLELLRDEQIAARGVDTNADMVQACREMGFDVQIGDAIAHLKSLPASTLGALTGFHIIEHISLETLIELIEQAHRVLRPGGVLILETPNPENIVVGSCNFYIDPTHQRPLPPVLTQFLVEACGFADVQIRRVNAELLPVLVEDASENDPPALQAAVRVLRGAYQCAPDYCVVGRIA